MKFKSMSIFAGILALTVVAAPLVAQACNGTNKEENTSETNLPRQTQTNNTTEEITFLS
ncbi:MAG TPA: hypothetical protein ACFCUY_08300 [Xenococcaceae cyanobacterium]